MACLLAAIGKILSCVQMESYLDGDVKCSRKREWWLQTWWRFDFERVWNCFPFYSRLSFFFKGDRWHLLTQPWQSYLSLPCLWCHGCCLGAWLSCLVNDKLSCDDDNKKTHRIIDFRGNVLDTQKQYQSFICSDINIFFFAFDWQRKYQGIGHQRNSWSRVHVTAVLEKRFQKAILK